MSPGSYPEDSAKTSRSHSKESYFGGYGLPRTNLSANIIVKIYIIWEIVLCIISDLLLITDQLFTRKEWSVVAISCVEDIRDI